MDIIITADKKIEEIQKAFQKRFPFLKIEFFDTLHSESEGTGKDHIIDNQKKISAISSKNSNGKLHINGLMKVYELEQGFLETFGLNVQVFRLSNNIWIQTTKTDNWILAEQNQKARENSLKSEW